MGFSPRWVLPGDGPLVRCYASDGTESLLEIQEQSQALVVLPWWEAGAVTHLLVGFVNSAGVWSLYRFNDSDGDGLPDVSTKVLLFDTGNTPSYVTYLARDFAGTDLYLLDRRCQDVLVAHDSDLDGWPDQLQPTPFAQSFDFPGLLQGRMIIVHAPGQIDVPSREYRIHVDDLGEFANFRGEIHRLIDADEDGVAETSYVWSRVSGAPSMYGHPFDGQTALKVGGVVGRTVEAWTVAELGETPVSQIGTATLGSGPWTSLSLQAAIAEGQRLRLNYAGSPQHGVILRVRNSLPQLEGLSSHFVDNAGGTLELTGVNLHSSMVVRLRWGTDWSHIAHLAVVVHDSECATVTVQPLPADAAGSALFEIYDPSHPILEGLSGMPVSICEEE